MKNLKVWKDPKVDNSKKSASFKSLNVLGKIDSFKDFLGPDFQKNNPKSVLKDLDLDLDLKDKIDLPDGHLNKNKSSLSSYLKPEVDKLDLGSQEHSYFKTENIKNTFKQNFVNNSGEAQTNLPKDFRLDSNFNKTFPFGDLQEPLGLKNANSQIVWKNLMSFRDLFKDSSLVDFFKDSSLVDFLI